MSSSTKPSGLAINLPSSGPTNQSGVDRATIVIPTVPEHPIARLAWLREERERAVQPYCQRSKRLGRIPDVDKSVKEWLTRIDGLLNFLQYDFPDVSPYYRDKVPLTTLLKFLYADERFHIPEHIRERAEIIHAEFETINWGEPPSPTQGNLDAESVAEDDENHSGVQQALSPTSPSAAGGGAAVPPPPAAHELLLLLPPANHPIWGVNGIMHGVAPKVTSGGSKIRAYQLDRRYAHEKRSATVFGDNGLQVGAWFANQLVALFHGGHGSRGGGISGSVTHGAYSIVVAGAYKHADDDQGDTIIYTDPGAMRNTDPDNMPPGSGTRVLQASLNNRPVRVFRSAGNALGPSEGIRYDGLYRVTRQLPQQRNDKGGLYCRFFLERLAGQEPLSSVWSRSPTRQQKRDYARMRDLW